MTYDFVPLYTYADYEQWEGNWELINGHPHAISPSPLRKHQVISKKFIVAFDELLESDNSCKDCSVYFELDWIVSNDTIVRPDVMIVCGEFKDDFLKFPPTLVVEILSKATSLKDRHVKHQLYEAQGVKFYILVNPDTQATEIFELVNGEYVQNNTISRFALHGNCELAFDIPAFVQGLKLD